MCKNELQFRISKLEDRHLDEVEALELESFTMPWSRNMIRQEIHSDYGYYIAAELDDIAVGYAGIQIILDTAHITTIAVSPLYRGLGLGQRLICELISVSRMRRLREITLEVRVSNIPAMSMYRKFGFEKLGLRKKYYEHPVEDAAIMTLCLGYNDEYTCN